MPCSIRFHLDLIYNTDCSSLCSHVITDGFPWEEAHLHIVLAEVTATDDRVRPSKAKSEHFSLIPIYSGNYSFCE